VEAGLDRPEFVAGAPFLGEAIRGRLGPATGFGGRGVAQEVILDRLFEFRDTRENASSDALIRDRREEALDKVEPRGTGRCDVHVEA
jgi:hypothetical protein